MTQQHRSQPLDYATPGRTDVIRGGAGMLLLTGLAMVFFGGIFLICGWSLLAGERSSFDNDRAVLMFFVGVFAFLCLVAGLIVIRAGMRRG
jgi:hypothetical protein